MVLTNIYIWFVVIEFKSLQALESLLRIFFLIFQTWVITWLTVINITTATKF